MGIESDPEKRRASLSAAKQSLLEKRLRGEARRDAARTGIPRRPPGASQPLSFSQRRLWFLDRLEPGSKAYNIPLSWRISGALDAGALKRSLDEVRARHAILRTAYRLEGPEPRQFIQPVSEIPWGVTDLSSQAAADRDREWRTQANAFASRPFNLAGGEVIRAHLWRLSAGEHVLVISQHHIASDAWSSSILFREMSLAYQAIVAGRGPELPELAIQYADFAAWQQETFTPTAMESLLRYWKDHLQGAPPVLELPTDRPRPPVQRPVGRVVDFRIPRGVADQLRSLAQEEGATLFMMLAAAFNALLHRYSRQRDIVLGTPVAGRARTELERLLGFFVNTLPLRTNLSGDPTFVELLARVKEATLGALAHAEMPFERLVEELSPARDQSYAPLFQVMFLLQNAPRDELDIPGLQARPVDLQLDVAKFDLTLGMTERGGELEGWFEFNTDLFDASTIDRMIGHWEQLLWGIAANPRQRVSALPILKAEERRQLLIDWNTTAQPHRGGSVLHELFEAQAGKTPDSLAVVGGDTRLTYRELDERANQLAHRLRSLGVSEGSLVALCLPRSPEMVVGLLGVLKAGGAYVPVDPDYPAARIGFMLQDAHAPVTLTLSPFAGRIPEGRSRIVCLDTDWTSIQAESRSRPGIAVDPSHCAYVLYTSGSTGQPKGAMIPHRAIANHMHWMQRVYPVGPSDVVFQKTPFSFDASVWEFYAPLLAGGRLLLAAPGGHRDPGYLIGTIAAARVTVLQVVPSLLRSLVEHPRFGDCDSLRRVFCGGEPLARELVQRFRQLLPRSALINLYGPTEATIDATAWDCTPGDPDSAGPVPIGRPIDNVRCYIVDEHAQPVPVGVPGELYLGGRGVGLGYWRRPEETAQRFLTDPFLEEPGARVYRTGDLCRYLANGAIEFLGRLDHQVKIRGFRIELGEIEAALFQHAGVKQAVAIVRDDPGIGPRLAAYLELQGPAVAGPPELRAHLKRLLPEHMLPAVIMVLPALPMTPNGKIDRASLPAPETGDVAKGREFVAPADQLETQIAQLWERLLDVPRVGRTDNFFELGGHSLLAVHLFVEIEKVLGKNLPLATLFTAPTVADLARVVREGGGTGSWSSLVPIQPRGTRPPLFCIHAAGGNVLFYRDLALRLGEDQPFYGLQPKGLDGSSPRHTTVEEMAAHYLSEIRTVQPHGPYYLGGASYGGLVAWEMACQLHDAGEPVKLLALFDTHGPGYPETMAGTSKFAMWVQTQRQVLQHHWSTFWMLPRARRLEYLASKGQKLRRRVKRLFRRRMKRVGNAVYRLMGRSIPESLQVTQDVIVMAGEKYRPRRYRGPVVVFRASQQPYGVKPNRTLGWDTVADGELRVVEIPGFHGTMVVEPRVGLLVAQLQPMLGAPVTGSVSPR
jgi:amino acid adenylation domain-containing protein